MRDFFTAAAFILLALINWPYKKITGKDLFIFPM